MKALVVAFLITVATASLVVLAALVVVPALYPRFVLSNYPICDQVIDAAPWDMEQFGYRVKSAGQRIQPYLIKGAMSPKSEVRNACIEALRKFAGPSVAERLVLAYRTYGDERTRNSVVWCAIGRVDAVLLPILSESLGDARLEISEFAIRALVKFPCAELAPLNGLLASANKREVGGAMEVLSASGCGDAEPLRGAIRSSLDAKDSYLVSVAARCVGVTHDQGSLEKIVALVKEEDEYVRSQSIFALGEIGDRRHVALISPFLEDTSILVHQEAEAAIAKIARREKSKDIH